MKHLLHRAAFLLAGSPLLVGAVPRAHAMPYPNGRTSDPLPPERTLIHDNDVRFGWSTHDALLNIQFNVTDFSISPGQDSDPPNHRGDTHSSQTDVPPGDMLTLRFHAGRHGTSQVADWWNAHVKPSQNNYNFWAYVMNFAFQGNLRFMWYSTTTIAVDGFTFGQTHHGNHNNWWIGGRACSNGGHNCRLYCLGHTDTGHEAVVELWRGGDDLQFCATPAGLIDPEAPWPYYVQVLGYKVLPTTYAGPRPGIAASYHAA